MISMSENYKNYINFQTLNFYQNEFGLYNHQKIEIGESTYVLFIPRAITHPFVEIKTPDFALKFVCTMRTNTSNCEN